MVLRARSILFSATLACVTTLAFASLASAAEVTGKPGRDFARGQVLVRAEGEKGFIELELPAGVTVREAVRALNRNPDVAYAVPNYIAHAAEFIPNDPGKTSAGDVSWQQRQWNFLATEAGVDAPSGWQNLIDTGRPGASGVKVAVVDTGIAYRTIEPKYRRSPDFSREQFTKNKYDWVGDDTVPLDKNGHGTHVAGAIAERTNNEKYVTGLAYGVKLMPLRALDSGGSGFSGDIARAIRFAANHRIAVINLSLEFDGVTDQAQIPGVIEAINYAHAQGSVIVAAAGNIKGTDDPEKVAYPARASHVIATGGTTADACLASYSQHGQGLDLVAPGGGPNGSYPSCEGKPNLGTEVFQVSFSRGNYTTFGVIGKNGTSMASPHVAATAALIIASGVLGDAPSPSEVQMQLKDTARDLGDAGLYGAGLLDAGGATSP
jgi:serine protease